jgi:hypothetical protein
LIRLFLSFLVLRIRGFSFVAGGMVAFGRIFVSDVVHFFFFHKLCGRIRGGGLAKTVGVMLYTIPLTHNEDLNAFDIVLQENSLVRYMQMLYTELLQLRKYKQG